MAASNDFFDDPPQRVSGSPATATALVDGTSANTVFWYTGEDGSGSARSTATARIDPTTTVSYGTRANEQGIRSIVQNLAALAATTYSASDPNASASYAALNSRVYTALGVPAGVQNITDIESSLANAQTAMASTKSQHQQTSNMLTTMQQSIEGVDINQVGAQILSLQTAPFGVAVDNGKAIVAQSPQLSFAGIRLKQRADRAPCSRNKKDRGHAAVFLYLRNADQARASKPAASSRLMLISEPRVSGFGSACTASVCLNTKIPRLATFWRKLAGSEFPGLVAEVTKIDHSLRLNSSAASSSGFLSAPAVADRLQARGRAQKQIGFQFTRICGLIRDRAVRAGCVSHCRAAPFRKQSGSWRS